MSSNRNKKSRDEVEELLKEAEDQVFLKLNVNSHMSRVAPSYLQSDLDHRFQSLKKPSSSRPNKSTPNHPNLSTNKSIIIAQSDQDDDHLFARFATLKGTLPSSSSNSVNRAALMDGGDGDDDVDKIIQWAIDAARLDPSPPTDTDDDDEADVDDDTDETDEDDDDDDDDGGRVKKLNPKKR